jgi:hypothetical protein
MSDKSENSEFVRMYYERHYDRVVSGAKPQKQERKLVCGAVLHRVGDVSFCFVL